MQKTSLSFWQNASKELKNFFSTTQKATSSSGTTVSSSSTTEATVKTKFSEASAASNAKVTTHTTEVNIKKEHRASLTRGLSRYGPWGYLMLGMLLCGGALLVCGLWGN